MSFYMENQKLEELADKGEDGLFIHAFNQVQKRMNQTAHDKGWYDSVLAKYLDSAVGGPYWTEAKIRDCKAELQNLEDSRRLALIHSEVSEALENVRHGFTPDDKIPQFSGAEAELADVIIRCMDFAEERGFRVAEAIVAKAAYNKTRPYRHGNKTC